MKRFAITLFISIAASLSFSVSSYAQLNILVDRSEEHCLLVCKKYGNYFLNLMEKNDVYYITCAQTTNTMALHWALTNKICKTNNYRYICTVINSIYNRAKIE